MKYYLLLLLLLWWLPDPVQAQRGKTPDHIGRFINKFLLKQQDVTIVLLDGSISTDMGYAGKRADQAYRPPCSTEYNIPSFIEEKLRWKEQQFRRYDAHIYPNDSNKVFTELGKAVTRQFDSAWDWQNRPPASNGYNGLTRIVSGKEAAVSYSFPKDKRRCDFIYRTDYLCSASLKVSVENNKLVRVFDEHTGSWKQADGYIFSAKEKDDTIRGSFYPGKSFGANSLRRSVYQKRLKFLCIDPHEALKITVTSMDGGRICYWGITFSPKEYMVQFINSARGGHDIALLSYFEKWSVDYWKPDLILYSCNTINEGADVLNGKEGNNPAAFSNRFGTFIDHLLRKPYKPEVFAWILFTAKAHGIIDERDNPGTAFIKGYGEASVFDYIDRLNEKLKALPIASANAFYYYWNKAVKTAREKNTTVHSQLFGEEGTGGRQYVGDNTHLNDYGAETGWEYLSGFFDF